MNNKYDVIVLGLGANGSSAAYHLSQAGYKVCGIERFTPPHNRGSSHGQSRIIRQAYHEHPMYVPFLKEAYKEWHRLEQDSGAQLLLKTGGIILGNEDSTVITGAQLSAETHGIAYDYQDSKAIKERFAALKPSANTVAVVEKEAGILFPEKCITAFLESAAKNGAVLKYNEEVLSFAADDNGVSVATNKAVYTAAKLVITAGAWLSSLVPELHLPLSVARQALYWFKEKDAQRQAVFKPDKLPIYIWEFNPDEIFYGFPDLGDGIKIARHHKGRPIAADELRQEVSGEEIEDLQAIAQTYLHIDATFNYAAVCMYTNTPDEHFIIDHHPQHSNVIIASPCSGHGFKFASIIGKILAGMGADKAVGFDLSPFRIGRFAEEQA